MDSNKKFNFEAFKNQTTQDRYAGKPFDGVKDIFALLLKHFLEAALKGELHSHLKEIPCRLQSCTSVVQFLGLPMNGFEYMLKNDDSSQSFGLLLIIV